MDNHFPLYFPPDDISQNQVMNTPADQLQPFMRPNMDFTLQMQWPTVPTSVPIAPELLQTYFPPAYYDQYSTPPTSPTPLENVWALTDSNHTTGQIMSQVCDRHFHSV